MSSSTKWVKSGTLVLAPRTKACWPPATTRVSTQPLVHAAEAPSWGGFVSLVDWCTIYRICGQGGRCVHGEAVLLGADGAEVMEPQVKTWAWKQLFLDLIPRGGEGGWRSWDTGWQLAAPPRKAQGSVFPATCVCVIAARTCLSVRC